MDTVTFNIWYTQKLDANFNFGNMVLHDLFFSKQLCCYYATHCGKSHIFVTNLSSQKLEFSHLKLKHISHTKNARKNCKEKENQTENAFKAYRT